MDSVWIISQAGNKKSIKTIQKNNTRRNKTDRKAEYFLKKKRKDIFLFTQAVLMWYDIQ